MSSLLMPTSPPTASQNSLRRFWQALTHPSQHGWACVLILLGVCGIFFFYGLNSGELWRTEGLRAILAADMLRTGNWLVPMLYGEPMLTKPPGMYLAIVLCSWPFGTVTEFSTRLPSALAATGTVFLVYWFFGRQLGRLGGFIAALIMPISPMWLEKATSSEIDMLQVFWTTAAILFLLRAVEEDQIHHKDTRNTTKHKEEKSGREAFNMNFLFVLLCVLCVFVVNFLRNSRWWFLALLCVAGGVLTKWTTPAFFYGTALPLLWWRGQLRLLWSTQHLLSAALTAALCLAWIGLAIADKGWPVFAAAMQQEALPRLVPSYSPRPYPWGETLLHPLKLMLIGLPFSALALLTLQPGFSSLWDERGKKLLAALHCWVWPNMLFWSLPTEHTARHSFPLYPGLSGLAAMVVLAWMTGRLPWRLKRLKPQHLLIGAVALWISVKMAYVHIAIPNRTAERQARATGHWLASMVPIDQILYIFRLKDEGIMFYFGGQVIRLSSPTELPKSPEPLYCLLTTEDLNNWQSSRKVEIVQQKKDAQGDDIYLVRVTGS